MKYRTTAVFGLLGAAVAGWAIAAAPEIEAKRIDSMVADVLRRADANPHQTHKPDGQAIRADVLNRLQAFEVLKNEAIKAGLDKDPEVQSRFKNMEAEFYATQYAQYLERTVQVEEADLRRLYDQQTRLIKLQQVSFPTEAAAREAQSLLLKGLSFEGLMQRYPNPQQKVDGLIAPQQLPPYLRSVLEGMNRGDVTREPVKVGDAYYLLKLSAVERNPRAEPFEVVKNNLQHAAKQQKVQQQIEQLLQNNGVKVP